MTALKEWDRDSLAAEAVFREACEFIARASAMAVGQLPELEERQRGGERLHRFPEKSVSVVLGLKLVQLGGNLRAGELLIDSGLFFEWDMVQRSMQDALDDVTFLVATEDGQTKALRRYLEFFFDEDLDKDGNFTNRSKVGIEKRVVWKNLAEIRRQTGLSDAGEGIDKQARRLHRLRSGSVHGRAASIIRGYFDESAEGGLWLGGARESRRMAWERPTLYLMTAQAVSAFAVAGVGRWWEEDFVREAVEICERMEEATRRVIGSLKLVGWEGWTD